MKIWLALDGSEEPAFEENNKKKFEWIDIPAALIVRMRKLS